MTLLGRIYLTSKYFQDRFLPFSISCISLSHFRSLHTRVKTDAGKSCKQSQGGATPPLHSGVSRADVRVCSHLKVSVRVSVSETVSAL